MKSASPARMNSPEEPLRPSVIEPSATTVATPIAIPRTVSNVRTRWRNRFLKTSVVSVIAPIVDVDGAWRIRAPPQLGAGKYGASVLRRSRQPDQGRAGLPRPPAALA